MYPPAKVERKKVHKLISNGEIQIGECVVPSQYNRCNVNPDTQVVQLDTVTTSARKIPLSLIRKNLLDKHESLGIIRNHSDEYFKDLSHHQILTRLTELGVSYKSSDDIQQKIKDVSRTRHIKVWHDHSSIANHGYLLVLVSVIYDPAFFYSREEMKKLKGVDIDVVAIAQKPQVHILGRSSSSTEDQLMFVQTRRDCLKQVGKMFCTKSGVKVHDTVRFFYGDGPAAQFEAGHKQGGTYCCVGCGANSNCFTDIAYCYRAPKPSLLERQEFVLQGKTWKQAGQFTVGTFYISHTLL